MATPTGPKPKFLSADQARSAATLMNHVLTYPMVEELGAQEIAMAEEYLYEANMHLARIEQDLMLERYELFEAAAS